MQRFTNKEERHNLQLRPPKSLVERAYKWVNKRRHSLQRVLLEAIAAGFDKWDEEEYYDGQNAIHDDNDGIPVEGDGNRGEP